MFLFNSLFDLIPIQFVTFNYKSRTSTYQIAYCYDSNHPEENRQFVARNVARIFFLDASQD